MNKMIRILIYVYSAITSGLFVYSQDVWEEFGSNSYLVVSTSMVYAAAESHCTARDAHLTSSLSAEENAFLQGKAGEVTSNIWLGLDDLTTTDDNDFQWIDGSGTLLECAFTCWNINEPNNAGVDQHCASILSTGKWNDRACTDDQPYICKRPKGNAVTCPGGETEFNENCYYSEAVVATYDAAKAACVARTGSILTSIRDQAENNYLLGLRGSAADDLWFGYDDIAVENQFEWLDGWNDGVFCTNWENGRYPPKTTEDCVKLQTDGTWYDEPCTNSLPFVCKRAIANIQFADEQYFVLEGEMLTVRLLRGGTLMKGANLVGVVEIGTPVEYNDASSDLTLLNTGTATFADENVEFVQLSAIMATVDDDIEGIECFTIILNAGSTTAATSIGPIATADVCVLDASSIFWIDPIYIGEEGDTINAVIHRGGYLGHAADTIDITLMAGTATATSDYTAISSPTTVTFAPGSTVEIQAIELKVDDEVEGIERLTATLSNLGGADSAKGSIDADLISSTVLILDTVDTSLAKSIIQFADEQYIVLEGEMLTVRLVRSGTIIEGTNLVGVIEIGTLPDYNNAAADLTVLSSGTATFADETVETVQLSAIMATVDDDIEGLECFTIILNAGSTTAATSIGPINTADVCVLDASSIFWIDPIYIGEEGDTVNVAIHRGGYLGDAAADTIDITLMAGTATATSDYTAISSPTTVTFAQGSTVELQAIELKADDEMEGIERLTATLSNLGGADSAKGSIDADLNSATVLIIDRPAAIYKFQSAVYHVKETDDSMTIPINRISVGSVSRDGYVEISTHDVNSNAHLTAEDGVDFVGFQNDVIHFSGADSTEEITVDLTRTVDVDNQVHFEVCLSNPVGGEIASPQCVVIYIDDSDSYYGFDKPIYYLLEDSTVTVTVVRWGCSRCVGTVDLTTSDVSAIEDEDYVGETRRLSFAVQQHKQVVTIASTSPDFKIEGEERFEVCLSNPLQGDVDYLIQCATIVIEDCDDYRFTKTLYHMKEDSTLAMTVLRKGCVGVQGAIELRTSDITATEIEDYIPTIQQLSFAPKQYTQTVSISSSAADLRIEGEERFEICLQSPGTLAVDGLRCSTVFIEDCDAEVSFGDISYHVREDVGSIDVNIIRRGNICNSNSVITVDVIATSTTNMAREDEDYVFETQTIVFGPRDATLIIGINILDDELIEHVESFRLSLQNVDGGLLGFPQVADVFIEDNDGDETMTVATTTGQSEVWPYISLAMPVVSFLLGILFVTGVYNFMNMIQRRDIQRRNVQRNQRQNQETNITTSGFVENPVFDYGF